MFLLINYYDPDSKAQGEIIFREDFFKPKWTRVREKEVAKIRKITVRKELGHNDACTEFRFIN